MKLTASMLAELRRYPRDSRARPPYQTASALALVRRGLLSMSERHVVRLVHVHPGRAPDVMFFDPPRVMRECWLTQAGLRALEEAAP